MARDDTLLIIDLWTPLRYSNNIAIGEIEFAMIPAPGWFLWIDIKALIILRRLLTHHSKRRLPPALLHGPRTPENVVGCATIIHYLTIEDLQRRWVPTSKYFIYAYLCIPWRHIGGISAMDADYMRTCHRIAAYAIAYFAKIRISHIFPHI